MHAKALELAMKDALLEELDVESVNASLPMPMNVGELRKGASIFRRVDRFKTGAVKLVDIKVRGVHHSDGFPLLPPAARGFINRAAPQTWVQSYCDVDEGSIFFDALCEIVVTKRPGFWLAEEFLVLIGRICWMTVRAVSVLWRRCRARGCRDRRSRTRARRPAGGGGVRGCL